MNSTPTTNPGDRISLILSSNDVNFKYFVVLVLLIGTAYVGYPLPLRERERERERERSFLKIKDYDY